MLGSVLLALGAFAAGAGVTYLLRDMPERQKKQDAEQPEEITLEEIAAELEETAEQPEVTEEVEVTEALAPEQPAAEAQPEKAEASTEAEAEAEATQTVPAAQGGEDEKLLDAVKVGLEAGKMSTSLLQRSLGIGYGRALKLVNRMEALGLVSEANGNRARAFLPDAAKAYLDTLQ